MNPSPAYATGHIDIRLGLKKEKDLGEERIFIKLRRTLFYTRNWND